MGTMAESTASAKELNEQLLYTMYSVFRATTPVADDERQQLAEEGQAFLDAAAEKDV